MRTSLQPRVAALEARAAALEERIAALDRALGARDVVAAAMLLLYLTGTLGYLARVLLTAIAVSLMFARPRALVGTVAVALLRHYWRRV